MEDGVPATLHELTLSNLNYLNSVGTTVTIVNGVYNVPAPGDQGPNNNIGFDVRFNQVKTNVIRWPKKLVGGGRSKCIGTYLAQFDSTSAVGSLKGRIGTATLTDLGTTQVTVSPGNAFSPLFQQFNYSFEQNINYSLCLLPNNGSTNTMDHMVLENDQST